MTDEQIAALLSFARPHDSRVRRALADPQQSARTIAEWTRVLADVPAVLPEVRWDASHAVRRYYERRGGDLSAQFRAIEPHDVLAAWAAHRAELMQRHTDPVPAADPDDTQAWREELLGTRAAVAHGQQPPAQHRHEINPAGQKRLAALVSGVGNDPRRYIPADVAEQLAEFRKARAAREAAATDGQPDPYADKCTWCGAEPEKPCRTGYRPRGKGRGIRVTPHPCRIDAATRAAERVEDEQQSLARLMSTPPAPRECRARHTSGGDRP
ncbi:zinc finger domain-containing protein [Streptomyces alboflavus]|uniref:zinc finger domain-containing protein n=1 Tax=Streptomyces alboflavus TaxID=67267 RepID=UPI0036ABB423